MSKPKEVFSCHPISGVKEVVRLEVLKEMTGVIRGFPLNMWERLLWAAGLQRSDTLEVQWRRFRNYTRYKGSVDLKYVDRDKDFFGTYECPLLMGDGTCGKSGQLCRPENGGRIIPMATVSISEKVKS